MKIEGRWLPKPREAPKDVKFTLGDKVNGRRGRRLSCMKPLTVLRRLC